MSLIVSSFSLRGNAPRAAYRQQAYHVVLPCRTTECSRQPERKADTSPANLNAQESTSRDTLAAVFPEPEPEGPVSEQGDPATVLANSRLVQHRVTGLAPEADDYLAFADVDLCRPLDEPLEQRRRILPLAFPAGPLGRKRSFETFRSSVDRARGRLGQSSDHQPDCKDVEIPELRALPGDGGPASRMKKRSQGSTRRVFQDFHRKAPPQQLWTAFTPSFLCFWSYEAL